MRLALVDGTNAIMRRATVQKDLPLDQVVRGTILNIGDFCRFVAATHLIVAFDSKTSWRRDKRPDYKADRTVNTGPYANALLNGLAQLGVRCIGAAGFEADDVIATYAKKAAGRAAVITLSSDTDILALRGKQEDGVGVYCARYKKGGGFELPTYDALREHFGIAPAMLPLYHALVGGKNGVAGVPGIGKKRATEICSNGNHFIDFMSADVDHDAVQADVELLALRDDAPVPALTPRDCVLPQGL